MRVRRKNSPHVEYYLAPDVTRLAEFLRRSRFGERHSRNFRRTNRALLHEFGDPFEMLAVPGYLGGSPR
jgi:hypothetical protein